MSAMSRDELNDLGLGLCSVPMWMDGYPAGFCDNEAFGFRPRCREWRHAYTGDIQREDGRYSGYVPGLACPAHGGPRVRTFKDGNAWCAVRRDFINLQESHAGFGSSPEEAIAQLEATP